MSRLIKAISIPSTLALCLVAGTVAAADNFQWKMGTDFYNGARSIAATRDGGAAVAGKSISTNVDEIDGGGLITKMTSDGTVEWTVLIRGGNAAGRYIDDLYEITDAADQTTGYFLFGGDWWHKLYDNGQFAWDEGRSTPCSGYSYVDKVPEANGGGYLITCSKLNGGKWMGLGTSLPYISVPNLIRLDGNGSVVWARQYIYDPQPPEDTDAGPQKERVDIKINEVRAGTDGIYMTGYVRYDNYEAVLIKTDYTGELVWMHKLDIFEGTENAHAMVLLDDGDVLIYGYGSELNVGGSLNGAYLMRYDPATMAAEWAQYFDDGFYQYNSGGQWLKKTSTGDILLTGNAGDSGSVLLTFSPQGVLKSGVKYESSSESLPFDDIVFANDGGYWLAGGQGVFIVAKTDAAGKSDCDESSVLPAMTSMDTAGLKSGLDISDSFFAQRKTWCNGGGVSGWCARADWNHDGTVNEADVTSFHTFHRDEGIDYNRDGLVVSPGLRWTSADVDANQFYFDWLSPAVAYHYEEDFADLNGGDAEMEWGLPLSQSVTGGTCL